MADQILNRGEDHEVVQQGTGGKGGVLAGSPETSVQFPFRPQLELY